MGMRVVVLVYRSLIVGGRLVSQWILMQSLPRVFFGDAAIVAKSLTKFR